MHYDVCCQWYHHTRSSVLCKSPYFNGGRNGSWVDGEVIERMWSKYNGIINEQQQPAHSIAAVGAHGRITNA